MHFLCTKEGYSLTILKNLKTVLPTDRSNPLSQQHALTEQSTSLLASYIQTFQMGREGNQPPPPRRTPTFKFPSFHSSTNCHGCHSRTALFGSRNERELVIKCMKRYMMQHQTYTSGTIFHFNDIIMWGMCGIVAE